MYHIIKYIGIQKKKINTRYNIHKNAIRKYDNDSLSCKFLF